MIDTPGVNYEGVSKLNLNQVINNAVEVCHYVAFTILPRSNEARDNLKLKRLISRISNTSKTPTLVLATNRDNIKESPEEIALNAQGIANSLRDGNAEYPLKSVFVVSGKRKLLGEKMIEYIKKHNRKPELNDEDLPSRLLAEKWALFFGIGYDEQEKRENYEELSMKQLLGRCETLVAFSHMKAPLDLITNMAVQNSSVLSCNKAIENSLEASKEVIAYLKRLQAAIEGDSKRALELTQICEDVYNNILDSADEIRASLLAKIDTFKKSLQAECKASLDQFKPTIVNVIMGDEQWEFNNKEDADVKVQKSIRVVKQAFDDILDKVLDEKRTALDKLAGEVEKEMDEKFFQQLARIIQEVEPGESLKLDLKKPDFNLDTASLGYTNQVIHSHEKQTSLMSKLSSLLHGRLPTAQESVFIVNVQAVRDAAIEILEEYNLTLVSEAGTRVEDYMTKILDEMFPQAFYMVQQTSEAMKEKERLRGDSDMVKKLLQNMQEVHSALLGLLKDIPSQ